MAKIQIDMFEVQLGSSLLLQFKGKNDKDILVLADAGITENKQKGYLQNRVHEKLRKLFGSGKLRLDLVIGTHYDEDHLYGLVPIINDPDIEIGEAWLPPVANDTDPQPAGVRVRSEQLLAHQFAAENGPEKLKSYLNAKMAACNELRSLEITANEYRKNGIVRQNFTGPHSSPDLERDKNDLDRNKVPDTGIAQFQKHLNEADATIGDIGCDADLVDFSSFALRDEPAERPNLSQRASYDRFWNVSPGNHLRHFQKRWENRDDYAGSDAIRFAFIRKSEAKDAITASHLAKLVAALKAKGVPIVCQTIEDGKPVRFVWDSAQARFVPGARLASEGPELTLLGPSQGLVKSLRDKLPVGDYLERFTYATVKRQPITPSNQLSYIMRFEAEKQGILVSGDAGCVDFMSGKSGFYPALLEQFRPLHVIQVAHHAGYNWDFYNVLLEAKYAEQTDQSFLLISHATDDPTRPSREFATFIGQVRQPGDDMQLLFTSRPTAEKVQDYKAIIHKPVGQVKDTGDIRLTFDTAWQVDAHAISISDERPQVTVTADNVMPAQPPQKVRKTGRKSTGKAPV